MADFRHLVLLTTLILVTDVAKNQGRKSETESSSDVLLSVVPQEKGDIKCLWKLERDNVVDLWNGELRDGEKVIMRVKRAHLEEVKEELKRRKMKFRVLIRDLLTHVPKEESTLMAGSSSDMNNFDFFQYHELEEIVAFLKHVTDNHRNVSRLLKIGTSFEKRPLFGVKVSSASQRAKGRCRRAGSKRGGNRKASKTNKTKKELIMMECGIHAREWASVAFCVYFINQIIVGREKGSPLQKALNRYDFIIIPVMNPDGFVYTHTTDRFWRKTRSIDESNPQCVGVDANRNYDVGTEACTEPPCSPTYCGKRSFTEPEVVSLVRLMKKTSKQLKAFFSIHTFGQLWLLPWAKTDKEIPKDFEEMERVGQIGAQALEKKYGTQYNVGMASKILYSAQGSCMDYVHENGFANYTFALELRDKQTFALPADQLLPLCEETTEGVVAAVLAMK